MGGNPHLTAAKNRRGGFSGYYKCSLCEAEFRPNPESRMEMTSFYAAHVRDTHLADESTHDDPNQARVQVLDGATRGADN
jgi:hypothetical protein